MKKCLAVLLCLGTLMFAGGALAATVVLNFDDLVGQAAVPGNYAGLSWDPNWTYYDFAQGPWWSPFSGNTRIYTHNFGGWIKFNQTVQFQGANIGSDVPSIAHWEGYLNGVLQYTSAPTPTYQWRGFLASGSNLLVDEVRLVDTALDYFIVDDLTYSTQVPEPGAMLLLGSGLLGLARFVRRNTGK